MRWLRRHRGPTAGDYCSQLIYRMLTHLIPSIATTGNGYHVTPSRLARTLRVMPGTIDRSVDVNFTGAIERWDPAEQRKFESLGLITEHLAVLRYPHSRAAFEEGLQTLFERHGIAADPAPFYIPQAEVQRILTKRKFFAAHDVFWPRRYR